MSTQSTFTISSSKKTSIGWTFNNSFQIPYNHLSSNFQPLLKGSEIHIDTNTNIPYLYPSKSSIFKVALGSWLEQAAQQAKITPIYIPSILNNIFPLKSSLTEVAKDVDNSLASLTSPTSSNANILKVTKRLIIEKLDELLTNYHKQNIYSSLVDLFYSTHATDDTPKLSTHESMQLKNLARRIDSIESFKANPYKYAPPSIQLSTLDKLAQSLNISRTIRASGTMEHLLKQHYELEGHTCYPQNRLIKEAAHQTTHDDLKNQKQIFSEVLDSQTPPFTIVDAADTHYVYLTHVFKMEEFVAETLTTLNQTNTSPQAKETITRLIHTYEETHNTALSEQQRDAVTRIFTVSDLLVITGYPGSGKSTITECIRYIHDVLHPEQLDPERNTVLFTAPTGIAATRLNKGKGMTIHRALQVIVNQRGTFDFMRNATNPFKNRLIIVDEFSMVDLELAYNFLQAIIMHIIASQAVQTVKLTKIFRQQVTGTLNPIVELAKLINKGKMMPTLEQLNNDHVKFINQSKDSEIYKIILKLFKKHKQDCQILFPTKREASVGSINGNSLIANDLHSSTVIGKFAKNDKIICTKNCAVVDEQGQLDTNASIFNGEIGRALNVESISNTILFESASKRLTVNMENLEHGWCITVNKSQGSEYNTVIVVLHQSQGIMLNRQVLYTAVTRAKKLLYIIATPETLHQAITTPAPPRLSLLSSLMV